MTRSRLSAALALALAGLFALADLAAAQPPPAQSPGRRYALLIGVGGFARSSVPTLEFVSHDVAAMEKLLTDEGYEVTTIAKRADRRSIIEELYRHAVTLTDKDTFVLYYAGHGVRNVEINRKTYWLTYDAELAMLDVEGIRLEHLLAYVNDIRASRKLILLDHCFSGDVEGLTIVAGAPAGGRGADTSAPTLRTGQVIDLGPELPVPATAGTAIIAASRGAAFEIGGIKHGVLTYGLLQACEADPADANLNRSIFELVRVARAKVIELVPTQAVVGKVGGDIEGVDWTFCTLPVPASKVDDLAAKYTIAVQNFETKGYLSPEDRLACTAVLDKWKALQGDRSKLTLSERHILAGMRVLTDDGDTAPEQARAAALADILRRARS